MASGPIDEVTKRVQDATYVAIGLGILTFQRAQVRRRELQKDLSRITGRGPSRPG